MNVFKVHIYGGSDAFGPRESHYKFETNDSIDELAKRLAREGFILRPGAWIMPAAILKIEEWK